jgi:hypothetical protein
MFISLAYGKLAIDALYWMRLRLCLVVLQFSILTNDFATNRDTVSSVGALIPRTLPFAQGTNYIRHFRQAFALDEKRARYAEQPYIQDNSEPPFSNVVGSYFAVPTAPCSVKEVWFSG